MWAGVWLVWWIVCIACMKPFKPQYYIKPGVMTHACHPSVQRQETLKLKVNLGYMSLRSAGLHQTLPQKKGGVVPGSGSTHF